MRDPNQVADLWQSPDPLDEASRLLCLETASFPILDAYILPPVLQESRAFAEVMAAAQVTLLTRFGDAAHIIQTPALLRQFLTLPYLALLALVKSPKLTTDAEASVLQLVSSWLGDSVQQLQKLHGVIRYSRLSSTYLSELCDEFRLPQLTRKQLLELMNFCSLPSNQQQTWVKQGYENPAGWYLPQRPTPPQHKSGVRLSLLVTRIDLKRLLAGVLEHTPERMNRTSVPVYAKGFMWKLCLSVQDGELFCLITAWAPASLDTMTPGLLAAHGVLSCIRIQIHADEEVLQLCQFDKFVCRGGHGVQMTGPAGKFKNASQLDWWARFMVYNCVKFTAFARVVKT